MFYQILIFLLNTATGLLVAACLLRVLIQGMRLSFSNPVGQLVLTVSDWMVLPLRKLSPALRAKGRWDWLPLVLAWLLCALKLGLLLLILGQTSPLIALALGFLDLLTHALGLGIALILASVVLSWIASDLWLHDFLQRLCAPLLKPLRRVLPAPNGIDFSPLLASVGLYVLMMVVDGVEQQILTQHVPIPLPVQR